MSKYHFIIANGELFRFTCKAYKAWLAQSVKSLEKTNKPAKITRFATSLGMVITPIPSIAEYDPAHIVRLNGYLNG